MTRDPTGPDLPAGPGAAGIDLESLRTMIVGEAYSVVRISDVAEDVAQTVLLRILLEGGESRVQEVGPHYLRRAGRNQALQHLRNEERRRLLLAGASEICCESPPAPDRLLELAELRTMVAEVLDQLPPGQRVVARLSWLEERTIRQVASELSIGERRVERQRRAAKEKLESLLRDTTGSAK